MSNFSKMCKELSFSLKGGYKATKIDNIHEHLQEINRGKGVQKPKKGKGSYKRHSRGNRGYSE